MYCSSCGVAVTQGLKYCNYCGAKLSSAGDQKHGRREVKPELLIAAMAGVFIFGMVAITLLMGMMKSVLALPSAQVLVLLLVPLLIMVWLEGVFVRLLFRRSPVPHEKEKNILQGQATSELDGAQARALPDPIPSVTEHTTRAFAPLNNTRNPNKQ